MLAMTHQNIQPEATLSDIVHHFVILRLHCSNDFSAFTITRGDQVRL